MVRFVIRKKKVGAKIGGDVVPFTDTRRWCCVDCQSAHSDKNRFAKPSH
ncbi:hypothetical protein [Anaplasma platys]|nr:hypothetical protein [Anaplasma platys]